MKYIAISRTDSAPLFIPSLINCLTGNNEGPAASVNIFEANNDIEAKKMFPNRRIYRMPKEIIK